MILESFRKKLILLFQGAKFSNFQSYFFLLKNKPTTTSIKQKQSKNVGQQKTGKQETVQNEQFPWVKSFPNRAARNL